MNYALLVSGIATITYVKHAAAHSISEVASRPPASFLKRCLVRLLKRKQAD